MNGEIVASCTLLRYGDKLGWLGMVLTHPSYRRRGFARCLVESVLRIGEERGLKAIKLDASDEGLPLYENLGFRREQVVERWSGRPGAMEGTEAFHTGWAFGEAVPFELDRQAFGADRAFFLRELAKERAPLVTPNGYAMTRPGARAMYIGPCVAETVQLARLLIGCCFSGRAQEEWFWDLLPSNGNAVALATEFGFSAVRRLTRMVKGHDTHGVDELVYAVGGFEIG